MQAALVHPASNHSPVQHVCAQGGTKAEFDAAFAGILAAARPSVNDGAHGAASQRTSVADETPQRAKHEVEQGRAEGTEDNGALNTVLPLLAPPMDPLIPIALAPGSVGDEGVEGGKSARDETEVQECASTSRELSFSTPNQGGDLTAGACGGPRLAGLELAEVAVPTLPSRTASNVDPSVAAECATEESVSPGDGGRLDVTAAPGSGESAIPPAPEIRDPGNTPGQEVGEEVPALTAKVRSESVVVAKIVVLPRGQATDLTAQGKVDDLATGDTTAISGWKSVSPSLPGQTQDVDGRAASSVENTHHRVPASRGLPGTLPPQIKPGASLQRMECNTPSSSASQTEATLSTRPRSASNEQTRMEIEIRHTASPTDQPLPVDTTELPAPLRFVANDLSGDVLRHSKPKVQAIGPVAAPAVNAAPGQSPVLEDRASLAVAEPRSQEVSAMQASRPSGGAETIHETKPAGLKEAGPTLEGTAAPPDLPTAPLHTKASAAAGALGNDGALSNVSTPSPTAARILPQTHQMLDRVPNAPSPASDGRMSSNSASDAAMRIGIRTAAFGAVEVYTSLSHNQVGLTLHGTQDFAQWINAEMPVVENRLHDQHLSLGSVDLQHNSSGFQSGAGTHHHAPAHSFNHPAAGPEKELFVAPDQPVEAVTPITVDAVGDKRVSILI